MPYSRILLFAPLLATATVAFAADLNGDDCEDAQFALNGACIHETAVVDDTVTTTSDTHVYDYASIGPFVDLGDVFVGNGAIIHGWESHLTKPLTIGDLSTIGSRAEIGADCIIGQNVPVGRVAQIGANCTLGDDTQVGRGVILESDVTTGVGVHIYTGVDLGLKVSLDDYVTVGRHTTLGDYTYMGPSSTIGRLGVVTGGSSLAEGSIIMGEVGPNATIGEGVLIGLDAKVRKEVMIGSGAQIMDEALIGRRAEVGTNATVFGTVGNGSLVEENATVHGKTGKNSTVCAGDTVAIGVTIKKNKTSQGDTCTPPDAEAPLNIAVGGYHACARLPDATAVCWGSNVQGELGNGTTSAVNVPVAVVGLTDVVSMSAAIWSTCAVKTDGTVACWGTPTELGIGASGGLELIPVTNPHLSGVTAISSGHSHHCALKSDETLACWGDNLYGQLGDGNEGGTQYTPVVVVDETGVGALSNVSAVAGMQHNSCALKTDGTVWCWGSGWRLGNGSTDGSTIPVQVSGITGATAISMGGHNSFALLADGSVVQWGANGQGQRGDGTTTWTLSPTPAYIGMTDIIGLGGYESHACMLRSRGVVACTGTNGYGQLGRAYSGGVSATPESVSGLTDVAVLSNSGAGNFTCATKTDGTVECWGNGTNGSLGNGTFDSSPVPVVVSGLNVLVR
jgi:alpha-tubulin suppressor-like RCC1 family protein/UDP-3-O-[3-hydroxymyristoyl] glucosamine N-acyltransferase